MHETPTTGPTVTMRKRNLWWWLWATVRALPWVAAVVAMVGIGVWVNEANTWRVPSAPMCTAYNTIHDRWFCSMYVPVNACHWQDGMFVSWDVETPTWVRCGRTAAWVVEWAINLLCAALTTAIVIFVGLRIPKGWAELKRRAGVE